MQSLLPANIEDTAALRPLSFSRAADNSYAGRTTCLIGGIAVAGTHLLTAEETNGIFSLMQVTVKPGSTWTAPVSSRELTVYYIVEGRPTLCVGEQTDSAAKGAFVPAGTRFALQNNSAQSVSVLRLTLPTAAQNTETASFIGAETGALVKLGTHGTRHIVTSRQTQGSLLCMDTETNGGAHVPPHVHSREDETFYVLAGRFEFTAEDEIIEAGPGHVVFGPRNVAHSWRCVSPEGGRLLTIITPGENFETFIHTMSERNFVPARIMADPALAAEFIALNKKHGLRMLPANPIK